MLHWLAILTELPYILANIININESFLSLVLEYNTSLMFNYELCYNIYTHIYTKVS